MLWYFVQPWKNLRLVGQRHLSLDESSANFNILTLFKNFAKYVQYMESQGAHKAGVAKIIPPKGTI